MSRADRVLAWRTVGAVDRMPLLARRSIEILGRVVVLAVVIQAICCRYFEERGQQLLNAQQCGKNFLIHSKKPQ